MKISLIQEHLNTDISGQYSTGYNWQHEQIWFLSKYGFIAADKKHEAKIKKYFNLAKEELKIDRFIEVREHVCTQLPVVDLNSKFFNSHLYKYDTKWMRYFYNLNPVKAYNVKVECCGKLIILDDNDKVIALLLPIK